MIHPLKLVLFVVLSLGAIAASLHAWRRRQVYGFFRFFAFELLVLLIVRNTSHWFHEPLSAHQVVSWIILASSAALAAHAFRLLKAVGTAQSPITEDTKTVVENGAYRYIRHPLYASLILLAWGVFLKGTDWANGVLALAATALLIATARYEERFNIDRFGTVYSEYMKRTKMFIPFLF